MCAFFSIKYFMKKTTTNDYVTAWNKKSYIIKNPEPKTNIRKMKKYIKKKENEKERERE